MFEQLKIYYRNSPKRIGWSWFGVHVLLLVVTLFRLWGVDVHQTYTVWEKLSSFSVNAALLFSDATLHKIVSRTFFDIVQSVYPLRALVLNAVVYYGLFIFVCFTAKNTGSKKFTISQIIFAVLFILNCVFFLN